MAQFEGSDDFLGIDWHDHRDRLRSEYGQPVGDVGREPGVVFVESIGGIEGAQLFQKGTHGGGSKARADWPNSKARFLLPMKGVCVVNGSATPRRPDL